MQTSAGSFFPCPYCVLPTNQYVCSTGTEYQHIGYDTDQRPELTARAERRSRSVHARVKPPGHAAAAFSRTAVRWAAPCLHPTVYQPPVAVDDSFVMWLILQDQNVPAPNRFYDPGGLQPAACRPVGFVLESVHSTVTIKNAGVCVVKTVPGSLLRCCSLGRPNHAGVRCRTPRMYPTSARLHSRVGGGCRSTDTKGRTGFWL